MSNSQLPPATRLSHWQRYREQRIAHARDLRQLSIANRESPRCSKCTIVIAFRPDTTCHIADCPIAISTMDRSA
jgi:hypothetical protein